MTPAQPSRPTLLLVEDNDDDVFLMQRALKEAKIDLPLQIATDGKQALEYFSGDGKFTERSQHPIPGMVFLDLKLPYVHGFEVLGWIRQQTALKNLPVVVLTSSPEERDRKQAQELGAKAYLVKPPTGKMLLQVMPFLSSPS